MSDLSEDIGTSLPGMDGFLLSEDRTSVRRIPFIGPDVGAAVF